MHRRLLLLISLAIFGTVAFTATVEPDMVIEIFRHGARGPLNETYNPKPNEWGNDIGQLTPVGMRMHYLLGGSLKSKYPNLLANYDPNQVYVRSTDVNRTIMSAYSHMYGIYQQSGPVLADNISQADSVPPYQSDFIQQTIAKLDTKNALPNAFQAVPVHVLLGAEDHTLRPWDACPNAKKWHKDNEADAEASEVLTKDMAALVKTLTDFGLEIKTWWDLYWAGDNGITNAFQEIALPANIDPKTQGYKDLKFAFEWYTTKIYEGTPDQRSFYALNILNALQDYFNQKADGKTDLKFILLSAHDVTLLNLLSAFGIVTKECLLENYRAEKAGNIRPHEDCEYPQYASNIIFEFYKSPEPAVIFRYNGKAISLCGDKASGRCNLPAFKQYVDKVTNSYTSDDYKVRCGLALSKENPKSYFIFGGLAGACMILFVSLIMTCVSLSKKTKRISELGVQMEVQPQQNDILLN